MKLGKATICNDKTVNMVQLPPAEPPEANVIETFVRLTTINGNTNIDQASNSTSGNPLLHSIPFPNNQSSIIIDQFSQLTEELKNCTKLVSSNLSEMAQAHKTVQEQTGKFLENVILQALTKTQDTTVLTSATLNTNTLNVTYASLPYNFTSNPNLVYHSSQCTTCIK